MCEVHHRDVVVGQAQRVQVGVVAVFEAHRVVVVDKGVVVQVERVEVGQRDGVEVHDVAA